MRVELRWHHLLRRHIMYMRERGVTSGREAKNPQLREVGKAVPADAAFSYGAPYVIAQTAVCGVPVC